MAAIPYVSRRSEPGSELRRRLPELATLESLIAGAGPRLRSRVETLVHCDGQALPVYSLELGTTDANAPTLGLFGGIHGVERIGSQILLCYLQSLLTRLRWDGALAQRLERVRLVMMPLLNPGGMWARRRCNPNGVDLMRNAPVDAEERPAPLLGGQRLSRRLPWFRGRRDSMELEAEALCRVTQERLLGQPFSLSLDCHSGFGTRDRLWFPYARSRRPIEHLGEAYALQRLFQEAYPHHSYYLFEPQSRHYTTHGDLWDLLYGRSQQGAGLFLPLTLELGSWLWVKKNPRQLFRSLGLFNPLLPHRHERVLRRHLILLDFLLAATENYGHWLPDASRGDELRQAALAQWYPAAT